MSDEEIAAIEAYAAAAQKAKFNWVMVWGNKSVRQMNLFDL